jgi:hypothetical protein
MMRCRVEFSFESVLCHVHAFGDSPLPNPTHDRDCLRCHLLIELRHALIELDCCIFQVPGSHRNVPGVVNILNAAVTEPLAIGLDIATGDQATVTLRG